MKRPHAKYPQSPSHVEIQAYLFAEFRAIGLDARLEVRVFLAKKRVGAIDVVVFIDRDPVFGIEIKKHRRKAVYANGRKCNYRHAVKVQIARYETTGIPIDSLYGMKAAQEYTGLASIRSITHLLGSKASASIGRYWLGRVGTCLMRRRVLNLSLRRCRFYLAEIILNSA